MSEGNNPRKPLLSSSLGYGDSFTVSVRYRSETNGLANTGSRLWMGVAYGYPWKYRPIEDHLVVMTMCQVFKLKVYENVGYLKTRAEVQQYAEVRIREDIAVLKREERHQRGTRTRHDEPDRDKVWFRSLRLFHTDDGWYVGTCEGNLGPYPDRRLADIELTRYVRELKRVAQPS